MVAPTRTTRPTTGQGAATGTGSVIPSKGLDTLFGLGEPSRQSLNRSPAFQQRPLDVLSGALMGGVREGVAQQLQTLLVVAVLGEVLNQFEQAFS